MEKLYFIIFSQIYAKLTFIKYNFFASRLYDVLKHPLRASLSFYSSQNFCPKQINKIFKQFSIFSQLYYIYTVVHYMCFTWHKLGGKEQTLVEK